MNKLLMFLLGLMVGLGIDAAGNVHSDVAVSLPDWFGGILAMLLFCATVIWLVTVEVKVTKKSKK